MEDVLFLKPEFKEMIWGGNRLRTEFEYNINGDQIGECWAVSAHHHGDCKVLNGKYTGKSLSELWKSNRELFGNIQGNVFPLLIKIIDAKEDLSIQVHPDDDYASLHENGALGKTECWYILDCKENASIVIGHHANSKEELKSLVEKNAWPELIRTIPIKKGDFFQIEPGTVHAIKGGTLILETQQNSDITYRLYDYGRLQDGKPRELHLKKSIDVINCPHRDVTAVNQLIQYEESKVLKLIECDYYAVNKINISGTLTLNQDKSFLVFSVLEGNGNIDGRKIKKGDHFILPAGYGDYSITGDLMLISSYVTN